MRALGYAFLAAAALITLYFVYELKATSAGVAIAIGAWLVLPYALLGLGMRFLGRDEKSTRIFATVSGALALGGVGFLTYLIHLSSDPQGAIAVMFTPLYQLVAAVILFAILS